MEDNHNSDKKSDESAKSEERVESKTKNNEFPSDPKKEFSSKPHKSKFPAKALIMIAIAVIVVVVAVSVISTYNENQPVTQESPSQPTTQESSDQTSTQTAQSKSLNTLSPVKLSEEKRIFIPSDPKNFLQQELEVDLIASQDAMIKRLSEKDPEGFAETIATLKSQQEEREQVVKRLAKDQPNITAEKLYGNSMAAPMLLDEAINPKGKAVIIDMLWDKLPNRDFIQKANNLLAQSGYSVDIYLTDDATIGLYKNLPTMGYDYVVWRTHGLAQGAIETSATIYSGEKWAQNKFYNEQLAGQIHFGVPYTAAEVEQIGWDKLGKETYFTIGHKFVKDTMKGKFDDSVILIAGCDALSGKILADSFIDKGASLVIGWTDIIGAYENDEGILLVLEDMLVNKNVPEYAAKNAMDKLPIHPYFKNSRLTFVSSNI